MPSRRHVCFSLVLSFCSVPAFAQQYTAGPVHFVNPGPYTQVQLEAASGVHTGVAVTGASLGEAAQRLSDTGAFEDVGATFTGPLKAVEVVFTLKPIAPAQMYATTFTNLVWLSPEERDAALVQALPLYGGSLPADEKVARRADQVLTAALAAKGANATVTHVLAGPQAGRTGGMYDFVAGPRPVVVGTLALAGAPPPFAAALAKEEADLHGTPYNEGVAGLPTAQAALAPLFDAAYLDAHLTGVTRKPVVAADATAVDVTATIDPGMQYRVASIAYAGSPLLSAADFDAGMLLRPGDLASQAMLIKSLAPLQTAAMKGGYLDAVIDPHPVRDAAAHTVAYTVSVTPGEPYRLRSVVPLGLDAAALGDFLRGWRLKAGDIYDADYATHFLQRNTALLHLQPYAASFQAKGDPETHLVDLTINFFGKPRGR